MRITDRIEATCLVTIFQSNGIIAGDSIDSALFLRQHNSDQPHQNSICAYSDPQYKVVFFVILECY